MRVAHGVVDQQVRDAVADRGFRPRGVQPLEHHRVAAILDVLRKQPRHDRLAGNPHMQPAQIAVLVEGAGELALRDRVIAAMGHVLLARPDQLDRRARHLLGDQHYLAHPIMHRAAPTETAAEVDLVGFALRQRQARGLGGCSQRRLAILRRRPDLASLRRVARRRVHRLHRSVVLIGIAVDRLDRRAPPRQSRSWRRHSGCRPRPRAHPDPLSARLRCWRWRPWRSRPHPRRSAAHRARSWPATRNRRRPPRRCRRRAAHA